MYSYLLMLYISVIVVIIVNGRCVSISTPRRIKTFVIVRDVEKNINQQKSKKLDIIQYVLRFCLYPKRDIWALEHHLLDQQRKSSTRDKPENPHPISLYSIRYSSHSRNFCKNIKKK